MFTKVYTVSQCWGWGFNVQLLKTYMYKYISKRCLSKGKCTSKVVNEEAAEFANVVTLEPKHQLLHVLLHSESHSGAVHSGSTISSEQAASWQIGAHLNCKRLYEFSQDRFRRR